MPELQGPFISYSRKDEAFVARLLEQLHARGRDAWVDQEKILPSEEWMQSILAAIDAAAAVILVLSPDAITSEVCAREIDYAVSHSKRLIPIVCRPVDPADVPPVVRKLNWINFTNDAAFAHHLDALLEALDIDLDWVHAHTRLLVRAVEWEGTDRDSSRLLRGADLRTIEQELASIGATQTPQPTPLQKQFVLASRQAQTRRQRITIAGIGAALVATIALAVIAALQSRRAEHERGIAVARLLASQALKQASEATGRRDTALLLASAAVAMDPSPQAYDSLWQALLATQHARKFVHTGHTQVALALSPDGRVIASGGFDGELAMWDAHSLRPLASIERGPEPSVGGFAFSPDGKVLTGGCLGGVALRDPTSGKVLRVLATGGSDRIRRVAWSKDGNILFGAAINEPSIYSWEMPSGTPRPPIRLHESGVRDFALSPDGRMIVSVGNGDASLHLWDLASARVRYLEGHRGAASSVAFSRDGMLIASGDEDSTLLVHEVASGAVRHRLQAQPGRIGSVVFGADARWLASGSDNRTVFLWDLQSPQHPEVLQGHGNAVEHLAFSGDGSVLYSAGFEDILIAWDVQKAALQTELARHADAVRALALSGDRRWIASGGDDRGIRLSRLRDGMASSAEPILLEGHHGRVRALALDEHGSLLASGGDDDRRVMVWDVQARRPQRVIDVAGDVNAVAIGPDGTVLAAALENRESILLWQLPSGEGHTELAGHDGEATALAFNADGTRLYSGGTDQAIRVWDRSSGKEAMDPIGAGGTVAQLAVGGGALLASAAQWPGGVLLHDLRQPGAAKELPSRSPAGGNGVALSPDGRTLAYTADEFGTTIVLWDVQRAMLRLELPATATTTKLVFVSDALLASGHTDGRVLLWDIDMPRWPNRACAIANRNLTREEWRAAVGEGLTYLAVCPELPIPG